MDYFEVAKNFGVQDSVAEPTSTGKKSTNLLTCPHIMYSQQFVCLNKHVCMYMILLYKTQLYTLWKEVHDFILNNKRCKCCHTHPPQLL